MRNSLRTWVSIDKHALKHNAQVFFRLSGNLYKILAVIKSNAYGHGLVKVAKILTPNVHSFGVDNIDEALTLKKAGIKLPVLILGRMSAKECVSAGAVGFHYMIADEGAMRVPSQIIGKVKQNKIQPFIHLKIDTGMGRQGIGWNEKERIANFLKQYKIYGIMSHFSTADNLTDREYANTQFRRFDELTRYLMSHNINIPLIHHLNTSAFLSYYDWFAPNMQNPASYIVRHLYKKNYAPLFKRQYLDKFRAQEMARIGIGIYGLWPTPQFKKSFAFIGLKPALSWKTRVVQIKNLSAGTSVGYGATARVHKKTRIAVLPVGYYDGYSRALSSQGVVLIRGKRARVIGRISMNLTVVDVSKIPEARVWDETILIGTQGRELISAEELAERAGTISYEIVSRINPLIARIYP